MKIYTKTGDKGTTSLLGGTRLPKHHLRIEAYGTVDELNAFVGKLRDHDACNGAQSTLQEIQDRLFTIGSALATDPAKEPKMALPDLNEGDVQLLEKDMDAMDAELPVMKSFVLPGGHPAVSDAHVCRTVCRRAERRVLALAEEDAVAPEIARYLNRLSDYFFMLGRRLTQVTGSNEIPWKPRV